MRLRSQLRLSSTLRQRGGVASGSLGRLVAALDWPLVAVIAILLAVGLANLYSATDGTVHSEKFVQQLLWVGLGTGLFFAMSVIDYRNWHRVAWLGIGVAALALIVVRVLPPSMAPEINGSTRWLVIGPVRIQPSEATKIAVIVALARLLQDHRAEGRSPLLSILPGAALSVPVLLVLAQPDLGTAAMIGLVVGSVLLLLLRHVWPIFAALAVGLAAMPLFWTTMEGYQKDRVMAVIDPTSVPLSKGWQTQQSILAVGSGQITGKGFGDATQNRFNFLPEHWTDFPFSVWAEEWGFVGALAILLVFGFLILLCINAATRASDRFGAAICLGVGAMIFWQMVVNVSMVLGMAPVVGVTLPLISYGGSSMFTVLLGLGLVSSVSMRRNLG